MRLLCIGLYISKRVNPCRTVCSEAAGLTDSGSVQFYLYNTELSIRESALNKPSVELFTTHGQRIKDLDAVLTTVENWLQVFSGLPLVDAVGIHVDNFTQFLHCIVVLFKLTVLEAPGWNVEEVRRRADVFEILDSTCQQIEDVASATGMIDADGERRGLFFKAKHLWRAIKTLLVAEMPDHLLPAKMKAPPEGGRDNSTSTITGDIPVDDFLLSLADEPWLSDIFTYDWAPDASFDMPFAP